MRWKSVHFPRRRAKPSCRAQIELEALENRLAPAVDVLGFHNDLAGTGLNAAENQLTPANVRVGSFGKALSVAVDGQVYAQPLVRTGVTISGQVREVVFVATQHDSVYAIDANSTMATGSILWQRSFLELSNPNNNTLGASAITPVPNADVVNADIAPEIGITGTPVIDPVNNILYLVSKTKETVGTVVHYVQRLHAISLVDGADRVAPCLIGDTTGNTTNTAIYVYGSGEGSVTDPYNGTGRSVVQFDALWGNQRAALSLVNNTVYVEWASHGDNGPYHGWVVAWDVANLMTSGWKLQGVLNVTPNSGGAGIWMGSGRPTFEADGSAFYLETGNGTIAHGNPVLDANGFPVDGSYYEALIKVVADPATSPTNQNKNGWGLKVADYFIPYNQVALDNADQDFGSCAPLILPDSAGIPGYPHLLVAAGKEGKVYLLNRDNLGKFDPNNDRVLNARPDGAGHNTPVKMLTGALSTAAYFNGQLYWVSGYSDVAKALRIDAGGTVTAASQTQATFGFLPGSVSVSASGSIGGMVWIADRSSNQLHAYDASSLAIELWNSGQRANGVDSIGAVVKFAVPTVANGKVLVGTATSLVVYGLTPPANAVPDAPSGLTAVALSGSSIKLSWADGTASPNTASGYQVELSSDGLMFQPVTTAPAGAVTIAIGGLSPLTTYYFRIRGYNGLGTSGYSNVASTTTTDATPLLDFSAGFAQSADKLRHNGASAIKGTVLELTNGGGFQAGSAFSPSLVDVSKFTTQFAFQVSAGPDRADGLTFTIQRSGVTALGASGGGLGYGPDNTAGAPGIGSSVAVKFDLFSNEGEGNNSTGLYTNGAAPTNNGAVDLTPLGLDLHSGHVFQVNMVYDGVTIDVTLRDTQTGVSASQTYTIDIPAIVGGKTAYVGFTGGTGSLTALQDILTWTFGGNASQAPAPPSGLGAIAATGSSVTLTWTNNATNQTSFKLDRATDAGFTQNLITLSLPAIPNSYPDSAAGLAPAGTFFYRLRASNAAGDSVNSNVASVYIPVVPPKPTDAEVTAVSTSAIDVRWIDNAGQGPGKDANGNVYTVTGYLVQRKVGGGAFSRYATLPPRNGAPGGIYTWTDTNIIAGTFYEYHIQSYNVSGSGDFAGTNATALTAPPGSVSVRRGIGSVTVSWTGPLGAIAYNVYRGTAPGGEASVPVATGVLGTSWTDTDVLANTNYYYQLTAINRNAERVPALASESAHSMEASTNGMSMAFALSSSDHQIYRTVLDSDGGVLGNAALVAPGVFSAMATDSWGTDGAPMVIGLGADQQIYGARLTRNGQLVNGWFLIAPGMFQSVTVSRGTVSMVFGLGLDGQVYAAVLNAGGTLAHGWFLVAPGQFASLEAGSFGGANPELFGIGMNAQVYAARLTPAGTLRNGWFLVAPGLFSSLAVEPTAGGTEHLFGIGLDGQIYGAKLGSDGNLVSGWSSTAPGFFSSLNVVTLGSGDIGVFGLGTNQQVYVAAFGSDRGLLLSGWFRPSATPSARLAAATNANGRTIVLGIDPGSEQAFAQVFDARLNLLTPFLSIAPGAFHEVALAT